MATMFRRGDGYQQFRPDYPDTLFDWLARHSPNRQRALDVGCGSGQASRGLERHFSQVLGLDISIAQLQASPRTSTHYLASNAHQLPIPEQCLDLIMVAQAFHWFDQSAFIGEARRTLRPHGLLALVSYGLCDVEGLEGEIKRFHDGPLAPWWPSRRALVVAGYPGVKLDWPQPHFAGTHIERLWHAEQMIGYLDTWSALVQAREQGQDPLIGFASQLRQHWGAQPRRVRWPLRVKAWQRPA